MFDVGNAQRSTSATTTSVPSTRAVEHGYLQRGRRQPAGSTQEASAPALANIGDMNNLFNTGDMNNGVFTVRPGQSA